MADDSGGGLQRLRGPSGHLGRTAPQAGHTDSTARVSCRDSRLDIRTRL